MPISINQKTAHTVIERAYNSANEGHYSKQWQSLVQEVWSFSSKTYIAALGTILLAKAVNSQVDVGSIKKLSPSENPNTFSLRTLGHGVLVPTSKELDFSIRTTGREPLNNQPFFRYSHIKDIERVRDVEDLNRYKEILYSELEPLNSSAAEKALAAFILVGLEERVKSNNIARVAGSLTANEIISGVEELLERGNAGPWVVQALGSVFLQGFSPTITSRKLNDPSRKFPGDVQALNPSGEPLISLEARNKKVSIGDVLTFAENCSHHNIRKAIILELTGSPTKLSTQSLITKVWDRFHISLLFIDNISDFVSISSVLGSLDFNKFYNDFAQNLSQSLKEIEAPEQARLQWANYVRSKQSI